MVKILTALLVSAAVPLAPATAQVAAEFAQPIAGTRLDITATGEVARVPDIAIISAGVNTRAPSASEAMRENSARMGRVIAALKSAGVADRDIQTSAINLHPEYRYEENQPQRLVGYNASNQVTVRFRDIQRSGRILDALVAQGANQINGPTMTIDDPRSALDEARMKAVAAGRARAELYARSLGKQVARVISISESPGNYPPPPPMPMAVRAMSAEADTKIEPGEQKLEVNLSMVFELR